MRRNARTPRTSSTLIMLAVGLACGALVAVDADHRSPNTGMADSVALVSAFDRCAAAGTPANIVILSRANPSRGFAIDSTAATQRAARMPRVRAEDPLLSAALSQGAKRSTTFRRLLEAIDATDGLVYVTEGTCGQGVRACLHMSIELAGTNRLLRVLVNPRRAPGCELIASIGHELQHALEALSNPNIKTSFALFSFFHQIGREGSQRFETLEAKQMELAVAKEVCRKS